MSIYDSLYSSGYAFIEPFFLNEVPFYSVSELWAVRPNERSFQTPYHQFIVKLRHCKCCTILISTVVGTNFYPILISETFICSALISNEEHQRNKIPKGTTRTRTNEIRSAEPILPLGFDNAADWNHDYTWQWEQTLDLRSSSQSSSLWSEDCFSKYRFFWLTLQCLRPCHMFAIININSFKRLLSFD